MLKFHETSIPGSSSPMKSASDPSLDFLRVRKSLGFEWESHGPRLHQVSQFFTLPLSSLAQSHTEPFKHLMHHSITSSAFLFCSRFGPSGPASLLFLLFILICCCPAARHSSNLIDRQAAKAADLVGVWVVEKIRFEIRSTFQ